MVFSLEWPFFLSTKRKEQEKMRGFFPRHFRKGTEGKNKTYLGVSRGKSENLLKKVRIGIGPPRGGE